MNLARNAATTSDRMAEVLLAGGVIMVPTDTVYGLAALPGNHRAVERVFALKDRPATRNLPIMVADRDGLGALGCRINERVETLLNSPFVPGPLTIAVGVDQLRTPPWLAGRDEIAFRIPDEPNLLDVLRRVGPLFVTSANRHGQDTPRTASAVLASLCGEVDLAVDGGEIDFVPSTLINCRQSPPVIEREGKISAEAVMNYLMS